MAVLQPGEQLITTAFDQSVDNFIQQLIQEAEGDKNFLIKRLDAEHDLALGTDDQARARFLETVANKLEERIGRIPFDFEKFTNRELEDFARGKQRSDISTDRALARLAEDEKVALGTLERETEAVRQFEGEELGARGILEGTREEATGLAGEEVRKTEGAIGRAGAALTGEVGRTREDIVTVQKTTAEDLLRAKERGLEDITTASRRGAIDEAQRFRLGKEGASRALEAEKRRLERERKERKFLSPTVGLISQQQF